MISGQHHETELKYLIEYPDVKALSQKEGCERWEIEQIYLTNPAPGWVRRIRRVECQGQIRYFRTFKQRISDLTALEDEGEITRSDYEVYRREADPARRPIIKTRLRIPYGGHVLEVDLYPFWKDQAILEIELEDESIVPEIPGDIHIIRDVSGDPEYKNHALAIRSNDGDL